MPEPKTKPTQASVAAYIDAIADAERRADCKVIAKMMKEATGDAPIMWGASIVGFGLHAYPGSSGKQTPWPIVGFSSRKDSLTLYLMCGTEPVASLMAKLGKHKTGVGCLYIKRLSDVDVKVLGVIVKEAVTRVMEKK